MMTASTSAVGEHLVVVGVHDPRLMHRGHPLAQVGSQVADGVELGITRLATGIEVGDLRDRAAAQDADLETALVFDDHATFLDELRVASCEQGVRVVGDHATFPG